jgi:hypothetical protein
LATLNHSFGIWISAAQIWAYCLNQEWYRTAKIQWVAMLETGTAFSFLIIVALSVLPARLTAL